MTKAARAESSLRWTGIALALILFTLAPEAAPGVERDFFPEFTVFEGTMEAAITHERYETGVYGRNIGTEDSTAAERLRLGAAGNIYHPRFITFRLRGGWGLRQEIFESLSTDTARSSGTTEEYDLRAWLLPEHAYNLEVYAARRNPLLSGGLAPGADTVSREKGAVARYLKMPWSLEAGVNDISTSGRNAFGYDSRGMYLSGASYFRSMTTALGYSNTETSENGGVQTDRDRYSINNQLTLPRFKLRSGLERNDVSQHGFPSGPFTGERMNWSEDLSIPLPARLLAEASYSVDKDRVRSAPFRGTAPEEAFSRTETARFMLSHNFYASLRTNYRLQFRNTNSTGGDSDSVSESVGALYTKRIPGGRLAAGGSLGGTEQTREGAPVVLREQHTTAVPGSFLLNGTIVDASTITVRVRESSGSLVLLDPGSYTVREAGLRVEIFIVNLPLPFVSGAQHSFQVDYAMISAVAEVINRQTTYNLGLHLFDDRVNPYYRHSSINQHVVAGAIPGGNDTNTSDTGGLLLSVAPFTMSGEYERLRSQIAPFEAWRVRADAAARMGLTASVGGRLSHSRTVYEEATFRADGHADEFTETALQFRKDLPERHLHLSGGGSYGLRRTFATIHAYSANAVLLWRRGALETRTGFSSTYSSTSLEAGNQRTSSSYYYLTLTRRLF